MTVNTLDKYIKIDTNIVSGKPHIKGRRITVQNIVVWHERLGKHVDEICAEHNLLLSEVYAALAYYFDNQEEIDNSIQADDEFIKQLKHESSSLLQTRLQSYAA